MSALASRCLADPFRSVTDRVWDIVQEKAMAEKKVDAYNRALQKHHAWHQLKINPETSKFYAASCTGKLAKRLCLTVGLDDEAGWLDDTGFDHPSFVRSTKGIWRAWARLMQIGRALAPSESEQAEFGPLCKKIFR